jgi:hypothetical protein
VLVLLSSAKFFTLANHLQAHFWEDYAFDNRNPAQDTGTDGTFYDEYGNNIFQVNVLDFLAGAPPAAQQEFPPAGPILDPNLFNGVGDDSVAVIMSPFWPRAANSDLPAPSNDNDGDFIYPGKIGQISALLGQLIGGIRVIRIGYVPLQYSQTPGGPPTGPDAALVGTTERGMILFQ